MHIVYWPIWAIFSFRSTFWRMPDFHNISSLWCKKHEITLLSFQISSFHCEIFKNSKKEATSIIIGVVFFDWLAGEQQLCKTLMLEQLFVINHEVSIMESECVCYFHASKPGKFTELAKHLVNFVKQWIEANIKSPTEPRATRITINICWLIKSV